MRGVRRTRPGGKGKGKGNGGKGELGNKGAAQAGRRHEEDERVEVAPDTVAGGSHPWATFDLEEPEEEEKQQRKEGQYGKTGQWVLRSAREWWTESNTIMKWADRVEEEPEDESEERKQKVEDEREEREAEEQRRGAGEVESTGEKGHETEKEGEKRESGEVHSPDTSAAIIAASMSLTIHASFLSVHMGHGVAALARQLPTRIARCGPQQ